jgi:DNA-binding LacI/PurR family transcriptional regulator
MRSKRSSSAITIDDVAKASGVSKATASYVLNGRESSVGIKSTTAERVRDAAKTLGYRPNAVARMLQRRCSECIAILFQSGYFFSGSSGFSSAVLDGVSQACYEAGFDLMLHTRAVQDSNDEAGLLTDGRVDGVLVLRNQGDPTVLTLAARNFPVVQFFSHGAAPGIPSVDCDNVVAGRLAVDHLIDLGHRRIGFLKGPDGSVSARERHEGYRDSMAKAGLTVEEGWILADVPMSDRMSQISESLSRTNPPTAFVVWYDELAIFLIRNLRSQGIRVPEKVSLVGFDSLDAAEHLGLTSVHQPVGEMAKRAALMLIDIVQGRTVENPHELFAPRLDVRSSSGPPSPA